jgi:hypothetical protein
LTFSPPPPDRNSRRGGTVHFAEPGGVPDLRAEIPVALDAASEGFTSRPGVASDAIVKRSASAPYSFDEFEGIDDVALRLRHLGAVSSRTMPWM